MADITPTDVAEAVAKQIPAFFNDAIDQLRQGEGAYLRDGMPEGVVAKVGQAVGRSACRRFGANPGVLNSPGGERFEKACRPYLDSLNPGDGMTINTPFLGGQCPGASYNIAYSFAATRCTDGGESIFSPGNAARTGPITRAIVVTTVNATTLRADFRIAGQGQSTAQGFTSVGTLNYAINCAASPGGIVNGRWGNFTVTRAGGLPDNCGNPPTTIGQPKPRVDPQPPPFRFNPGPGVDVGIDVDVNPDGTITFDIGTGDITVDPFPDGDGGDSGGGDGPSTPGTPGSPEDSGSGGTAEGEAPPGEELVGVLVAVLGTPENPNVFDNNAATVYRGIGYIRMGYPNRLGVDITGGTVISPQFFHAQQRGLTDWAVRANLGYNLRVTPYYREVPS